MPIRLNGTPVDERTRSRDRRVHPPLRRPLGGRRLGHRDRLGDRRADAGDARRAGGIGHAHSGTSALRSESPARTVRSRSYGDVIEDHDDRPHVGRPTRDRPRGRPADPPLLAPVVDASAARRGGRGADPVAAWRRDDREHLVAGPQHRRRLDELGPALAEHGDEARAGREATARRPSCPRRASRPRPAPRRRRAPPSGARAGGRGRAPGTSCSTRPRMLVVAQTVCVMPSRSKCCWLRGSFTRAIALRTP